MRNVVMSTYGVILRHATLKKKEMWKISQVGNMLTNVPRWKQNMDDDIKKEASRVGSHANLPLSDVEAGEERTVLLLCVEASL
jgi:hypothetical protein